MAAPGADRLLRARAPRRDGRVPDIRGAMLFQWEQHRRRDNSRIQTARRPNPCSAWSW